MNGSITCAAYVGLATIAGFIWWFIYSDNGPKLTYTELVRFIGYYLAMTYVYFLFNTWTMKITLCILVMFIANMWGSFSFNFKRWNLNFYSRLFPCTLVIFKKRKLDLVLALSQYGIFLSDEFWYLFNQRDDVPLQYIWGSTSFDCVHDCACCCRDVQCFK